VGCGARACVKVDRLTVPRSLTRRPALTDGPLFHHFADTCILSLQEFSIGFNRYRLCVGSESQLEIECGLLANLKGDRLVCLHGAGAGGW